MEATCCFLPSCLLFPQNCSLPGKQQPLALSLQLCPPHTELYLHYQADIGADTKETFQRLVDLGSSWTLSGSQTQASLREFKRVSLVNLSIPWPSGNISPARTRWPRDIHKCTHCSLQVMASTWAELRANSSWSHVICVTGLRYVHPSCRISTNKICLFSAFILSPITICERSVCRLPDRKRWSLLDQTPGRLLSIFLPTRPWPLDFDFALPSFSKNHIKLV